MGRKDFQASGSTTSSSRPGFLRATCWCVAAAVEFSFVRDLVRDSCSHTGALSVDPVVIFKMALLGYLYGTERRLADEARLNLAYLWFPGYDLDETPTDHSILSKARARYGPVA